MEGNCPRCQARLNLPASGTYRCEHCNAQFEVTLGAPHPPAVSATPSPMPGLPFSQPLPFQSESPLPFTHSSPPATGVPPGPAAVGVAPAMATGLEAPCAGHPGNAASQVCERCGDFMCRLCTTVVEGRAYCPKCFDLLYSRGALSFTQRQFTLPGVTLSLGLGAFFTSGCALLALPLGVVGIITGIRALKEHRARPDLPKRGMTLTGLWLSGISIVITVVSLVAFIMMIIRSP